MKTFYYDIENARFVTDGGEPVSYCVPELYYQERAEWKLLLRDRGNDIADLSGVVSFAAAVDRDFNSGTTPLCRSLSADISQDAETGAVTVMVNAETSEFLAAVNGQSSVSAFFELRGLDASGNLALYVQFPIRAKMILDPDASVTPPGVPARFVTSDGVLPIVSSGGFVKSMAEVVDSETTSATITVLSGGMRYKFTQPLSALTVDSVVSSPLETEILFCGATVVTSTVVPSTAVVYGGGDSEWSGVSSGTIPIVDSSAVGTSRMFSAELEAEDKDYNLRYWELSVAYSAADSKWIFSATAKDTGSGETVNSGICASTAVGEESLENATWTLVDSSLLPLAGEYQTSQFIYADGSTTISSAGPAITLPDTLAIIGGGVSCPAGEYRILNFRDNMVIGAAYVPGSGAAI